MTWSSGTFGCDKSHSPDLVLEQRDQLVIRLLYCVIARRSPSLNRDWSWTPDSTCGAGLVPVAATDGYIDLKIKDEANAQINKLYNNRMQRALDAGPYSVLKNFVDNQPWFWGSKTNPATAVT